MKESGFETRRTLCCRQMNELQEYRELVYEPMFDSCKKGDLKESKTAADILKILQECERKVFAFSDSDQADTDITIAFED